MNHLIYFQLPFSHNMPFRKSLSLQIMGGTSQTTEPPISSSHSRK